MSVNWISPEQFSELKQTLKNDILCLDIRSEQEHQQSHIPGSCLVAQHNIVRLPVESLLIYCQSGIRTERLQQDLQKLESQQIYLLEGGLDAWKAKGMETLGSQSSGLSLPRQVHLIAGLLILVFSLLTLTISPLFTTGQIIVGSGLTLAGLTGFCGMARLLSFAPWNRAKKPVS
ncbi:rhodanese-like domain-containing protein [Endozoicomonas numazuensis]|uniref:Rhodanese domain-containing protein n=1 Tax=Endozoicomonas numazuensis TaxID=1137799 RepID=A0A081N3X6_9GAMM|nr:rhodanese-like domain-containing protein [Endozoicomonas numazuensis]KEQ13149.1 hypothetical protein GZ78_26755 [Endozoicomonas numazuensis]